MWHKLSFNNRTSMVFIGHQHSVCIVWRPHHCWSWDSSRMKCVMLTTSTAHVATVTNPASSISTWAYHIHCKGFHTILNGRRRRTGTCQQPLQFSLFIYNYLNQNSVLHTFMQKWFDYQFTHTPAIHWKSTVTHTYLSFVLTATFFLHNWYCLYTIFSTNVYCCLYDSFSLK